MTGSANTADLRTDRLPSTRKHSLEAYADALAVLVEVAGTQPTGVDRPPPLQQILEVIAQTLDLTAQVESAIALNRAAAEEVGQSLDRIIDRLDHWLVQVEGDINGHSVEELRARLRAIATVTSWTAKNG